MHPNLFISECETYPLDDAARLTDGDPAELKRLIAKGHLTARTLYLIQRPTGADRRSWVPKITLDNRMCRDLR